MTKLLETKENKKSFFVGIIITSIIFLSLFYIFPIVKSYENLEIRCIKAPCPNTFNMTINGYIKESKSYIKYLQKDRGDIQDEYYKLKKSLKTQN